MKKLLIFISLIPTLVFGQQTMRQVAAAGNSTTRLPSASSATVATTDTVMVFKGGAWVKTAVNAISTGGTPNFQQVLTNGSNGNNIAITNLGNVTNSNANFTTVTTNTSPGFWEKKASDLSDVHGESYIQTDATDSTNPMVLIQATQIKTTTTKNQEALLGIYKNNIIATCNPVNQLFPGITYDAATSTVVATNQTGTSLLDRNANDTRYLNSGYLNYYFTNTASDVSTYYKQLPTPAATSTISASGVTNGQVLANFITEPNSPGRSYLPPGLYQVNVHAAQTAGTKTSTIYAEIWETNSSGVDIAKIATTGSSIALTGVNADLFITVSVANSYTFASTSSRIDTRIYATVTGGGSDPTIALYNGGTSDSRTIIPSPTIDATNFIKNDNATTANQVIYGDGIGGSSSSNFTWNQGSSTMSVNGTFKYTDGNQANNYILKSDASGNSSWAQPTTTLPSTGTGSVVALQTSPALLGTPTAPTNTVTTDASTQIATDAFVQAALPVNIPPTAYTPTVTTWAASPVITAIYWVTGKTLHISYQITGTSSSTSNPTMTLPNGYTSSNVNTQFYNTGFRLENNGAYSTTPGMAGILNNSSTITFYFDFNASASWTGTGTKQVTGMIELPVQ